MNHYLNSLHYNISHSVILNFAEHPENWKLYKDKSGPFIMPVFYNEKHKFTIIKPITYNWQVHHKDYDLIIKISPFLYPYLLVLIWKFKRKRKRRKIIEERNLEFEMLEEIKKERI